MVVFARTRRTSETARSRCLQLDDPAPDRDGNGLSAVTRFELLHDVFYMNLDGLFRDEESPRDVLISVPARDLLEDLDLTRRQALLAHVLRQMRPDLGRNAFLP